jgi:hypothetical protein
MEFSCTQCSKAFTLLPWQVRQVSDRGRAYCSKPCGIAYRAAISSKVMAETNRKYASARMTERNPMADPTVRKRVSETLKRIGHGPKVRGGNGRPPTAAELVLAEKLNPMGFCEQAVIVTGQPRGSGFPPAYKADCGCHMIKLAIEADGGSHNTLDRQAQDAKKDELLRSLGWTVLRFTNQQILTETEETMRVILSTILKLLVPTPTSQTDS